MEVPSLFVPTWMFPEGCTICQTEPAFFMKVWVAEEDPVGPWRKVKPEGDFFLIYCKECFFEYGGESLMKPTEPS